MERNEVIKKLKNRKVMLGSGALLSMVAIVIVMSIFPFIIDPKRVFTWDWWVNEIFILVIVIYCVICTLFIGQAGNASDANSQIAKARKKFILYNEKIERDPFEQWVEVVLQPRDQEKVYKRVLRDVGIKQWEIVNLSRNDLKSLLDSPQRINNVWYDEITEEQFSRVIEIKNGKYNIEFVDPGYYLTDKNVDIEYTRSERAIREQKVKNFLLIKALVSKVLMVLAVGLVLGMFTRDLLATEQEKSVIFLNLFSRIMNICSSSFVGYITGCQENDISASYIEMKAETQKEFLEDKDFKPKSIEERAKEKFALKVKQENTNFIGRLTYDNGK